jgi:hypothetical protein
VTFGLVKASDPRSKTHRIRVWFDGVEVTEDCAAANDRDGWAILFVNHPEGGRRMTKDANGQPHPVKVVRKGRVRITMEPRDALGGMFWNRGKR